MEGNGEQNNEKTNLLGSERQLFRSLSGGDKNDVGKGATKYRPYFSKKFFSFSSDTIEEINSAVEQVEDIGSKVNTEDNNEAKEVEQKGLSTFSGVFAPVALSMWSSMLFLRMGYVVGNAGVLGSCLMLSIAFVILTCTILSISAIATNGAVEGGGVYFMLSRTLGGEFGGAIGTLLFFANVVTAALYASGCMETLLSSFGPNGSIYDVLPYEDSYWYNYGYTTLVTSSSLIICLFGATLFGKTVVTIFFFVCLSIIMTFASFFPAKSIIATFTYIDDEMDYCIEPDDDTESSNFTMPENCTITVNGTFLGLMANQNRSQLYDTFTDNLDMEFNQDCSNRKSSVDFAIVFAVLFSGVTGIMAGANISGDLKNPGRSIPLGTVWGSCTAIAVLLIEIFGIALTCDRNLLYNDCYFLDTFAISDVILSMGSLLVTFSASANSFIGGSRVLQAMAKDVVFGPFLIYVTKGTINENPITAVITTWCLMQLVLFMGNFNAIAQLCSCLFLLSYASVNLACLGLQLASAPNFRPSFKYFSKLTCFIGVVGCTVMMFVIQPLYAAVAILLCLSLVLALNLFSPIRDENWGSISQALLFHQVRKYLLMLDPRKAHVKFWRPQILLLVQNPRTCCSLIDFANTLKKGGLYVLGHVYVDNLQDLRHDPCSTVYSSWLSLVDHLKIKAFVELTVASSIRDGIQQLIRISGIGAMKPNTICMGFLDSVYHDDDFTSPFSSFSTMQFEGLFPPPRRPPSSPCESIVMRHPSYVIKGGGDHYEQGRNVLSTSSNSNILLRTRRIEKLEYFGVIEDILKMQKNVCLCRHFQRLNKHSALGQLRKTTRNKRNSDFPSDSSDAINDLWRGTLREGKKSYLDVWLVDFFSPTLSTDTSDTTSLFILQLACIVNMVPRWKKLKIRVFVVKPQKTLSSDDANGDDKDIPDEPKGKIKDMNKDQSNISKEEKELRNMLDLLRISAETHLLPWYTLEHFNEKHRQSKAGLDAGSSEEMTEWNEETPDIIDNVDEIRKKQSRMYLRAACKMVRSRSSETAVTFLYLPEPPIGSHDVSNEDGKAEKADNYLTNLELLTNHWPPSLLVRGVSPVTSTTL